MPSAQKIIDRLSLQYKEAINKAYKLEDLEAFSRLRNKVISEIKAQFGVIKELPPEERKYFGASLNQLLDEVQARFEELGAQLKERILQKMDFENPIDITAPWHKGGLDQQKIPLLRGNKHPLTEEIEKILDIFWGMGFNLYWGRQLDDDYHVFDALNIPPGHPAREAWDTFYTEEGFIPTTHTSNMQIRVIKDQLAKGDVVRAAVVGRTFRNEEVDATHSHTFYQMEGVVVHKKASLGELLGVLKEFLERYFNKKIEFKVIPAHFPFVEPGLEFSIKCTFCDGKGCSGCGRKGWLEILGAGMIHPQVLENAGVDPQVYKGYAWGFGVDRLVMTKLGIDDLRLLYSNDLNVLARRK